MNSRVLSPFRSSILLLWKTFQFLLRRSRHGHLTIDYDSICCICRFFLSVTAHKSRPHWPRLSSQNHQTDGFKIITPFLGKNFFTQKRFITKNKSVQAYIEGKTKIQHWCGGSLLFWDRIQWSVWHKCLYN